MQQSKVALGIMSAFIGAVAGGSAAAQESGPQSLVEQFWLDTYGAAAAGAVPAGEADTPSALSAPLGETEPFCLPRYDIDLVAKAKPDECYFGLCDARNGPSFNLAYPGDINSGTCEAAGGHPKVNQSYVWGLTMSDRDHVWFATAANVLCLVTTAYLQVSDPYETDAVACEAGCPGILSDGRPPRFFMLDVRTNKTIDLTAQILAHSSTDAALVGSTFGIRSAGSYGGVVFFGGLTRSQSGTTVVMYAFNAATREYLGAKLFDVEKYNNIRQWVVVNKQLYTGVGISGGGKVLRWVGKLSNDASTLFAFQPVGELKGDPAYLAEHKGRLFVSTWGGDSTSMGLSLYMSPRFGSDQMLTDADKAGWTIVWRLSEYEVEPTTAQVGGAIASYGSYLYWGTMQVPGVAAQAFCRTNPTACEDQSGTLEAFLGTLRPIVIFRGKDFDTNRRSVELLYGTTHLPKYDKTSGEWEIVPNNMHQMPKYGLAGINNLFNTYTWWMENWHGRLFVGTFDWLYLLAGALQDLGDIQIPEGIKELATSFYGADLYNFVSGDLPALPVSLSGAGNYTNYGIRTMVGANQELFLGTANPMNLLTDPNDNVPEGGWELRTLKILDCD